MSATQQLDKNRKPARWRTTFSKLSPALTVLGYTTVVILAPLIAASGDWKSLLPANTSPALSRLQIWLTLVAIQAAAWLFICTWMLPHLRELIARAKGTLDIIVTCILPTVLLAVPWLVLSGMDRQRVLPHTMIAEVRIFPVIGPIGSLVAGLAVFGVFISYRDLQVRNGVGNAVRRGVQLGKAVAIIHQFLFAGAAVLALGVVGTAALRGAAEKQYPESFKSEYVVLYGLAGSLILLMAYAPIRLALYRDCSIVMAEMIGSEPESSEGLTDWLEKRSSVDKLFGQDAKNLFGLGGIVTSLLPLVVGSVSKLFGLS